MATADTGKGIGLALQGGGAHAAFGWGVLDRLLKEVANGRLHFTAISGTSGGALNAAVCIYGLRESPQEAARLLAELWERVAQSSPWQPIFNGPLFLSNAAAGWNVDLNPLVIAAGMAQQVSSPYFTPWVRNPLGPILSALMPDFTRLNDPEAVPSLHVAATSVNHTRLRLFGPGALSVQALLASSCYPTLFEAVEIDGEFYWDGGFMANPSLDPLLPLADDLLTVLIDPLVVSGGPPTLPRQIVNRMNEVSFGASWVSEIGQIALINDLIASGRLQDPHYRTKRFHVISNDAYMEAIGAASKYTPSREFFLALRDMGVKATEHWLAAHYDALGHSSTFDVEGEVVQRLKSGRRRRS